MPPPNKFGRIRGRGSRVGVSADRCVVGGRVFADGDANVPDVKEVRHGQIFGRSETKSLASCYASWVTFSSLSFPRLLFLTSPQFV